MIDRQRDRGFTLTEALIASAVFSLIIVGVFSVYASNSTLFRRGQTRVEVQQNARVAVEYAAREIRVAGYDLSGAIATLAQPTAIQVGEDERLVFVADIDRDGVLDQVTYQLVGDELRRSVAVKSGPGFGAATTSILAHGLSALGFTYINDSTPFTTPVTAGNLGAIRRMTIGLVTEETAAGEEASFTHIVDVRLRN